MPTALELGHDGWKQYLEAARRRIGPAPLTPEENELRQRLLERVREAASVLKAEFRARRVILFGSLARGASFALHSDVDLAVEGLNQHDFWRAWRIVEAIIAERPVDLVEIELSNDSLRLTIEQSGLEL